MHQARKRELIDERNRSAWPTAVQSVTLFASPSSAEGLVVVHHLDYAIFTVLQLTCIAKTPFTVVDLVVNGEFHPSLAVGNLSERFFPLRLPMQMSRGSSFGAVLQAPAAVNMTHGSCYPKAPTSLVISTDHGSFAFNASEIIRSDHAPWPL